MSTDSLCPYPNAPDVERAVLSAMLFEDEAIDIASEALSSDAFYRPENMIVFDAICDMRLNGDRIDYITLCEELSRRGTLERIGGEAHIAALTNPEFISPNTSAHCEILNSKLAKRKLITLAASIKAKCLDETRDADDIASDVYMQSVAILDGSKEVPYKSMATVVRDAHEWLIEKSSSKGTMGIPTGLASLDRYIDGWMGGKFYIVAGRTGEGKSALAINSFALEPALKGIPTAIFSLEMDARQICVRMIACKSGKDLSDIQYQQPSQSEWARISEACGLLSPIPLFIDDTPGIQINQLGSKIRRLQRDKNIKLVIVDYLQLMEGKKTNSREQEVASISRGLKLLSKSLNIPIIALSQFSRAADHNDESRPKLSYLRESGSIEHDADTVIFVWNPTDAQKTKHGISEVAFDNIRELIISKNRGGKVGYFPVQWTPELTRFSDLSLERK